eukprot:990286_1
MDFSFAFLKGVNFKGVKLMRATFDNASLEKARLVSANCTGATFRKANCYEAKFIKTKLTDCDFTECNLLWCNFKNAKGDIALDSFAGADVGYAEFTKSCVTSAHLMGARKVDKAKNIPPPKKKQVFAKNNNNNNNKKNNTENKPRVRRQKSFGLIDASEVVTQKPKQYGNIDEDNEQ